MIGIIKNFIPRRLFVYLKEKKENWLSFWGLISAYTYDFKRYFKYSASKGFNNQTKLIGKIIKDYHVVEKGLTMPETRLGFGKHIILSLSRDCVNFILKYGIDDEQLNHAIGVVFEYEVFHHKRNFRLDDDIVVAVDMLRQHATSVEICHQRNVDRTDYFRDAQKSFNSFSRSRSSVRNYSGKNVELIDLMKALDLARNTPSACNRQTVRVQVYTDTDHIKKILDIQGGNRGFGHLANKLIVISSELGVFSRPLERNQAFIDGGMYAMNILYALHYFEIAACILNCSTSPEKDRALRRACYQTRDSEVFIAMISCGIPPDNFAIPVSKRYGLDKICSIDQVYN